MDLDRYGAVLRSYTIDGDLASADQGAVEVTVTFTDERRRWCFFITPAALASVGEWVEGTQVRLHLGEVHLIVVTELSRDVIERVLRQLEADGELERRTLPHCVRSQVNSGVRPRHSSDDLRESYVHHHDGE